MIRWLLPVNSRRRWRVADWLNHVAWTCWCELVMWALYGQSLREAGQGEVCQADAERCGSCYCGKVVRIPDGVDQVVGRRATAILRNSSWFYGVPTAGLGEENDVLIVGHPDDRRVVAALNAYARRVIGEDLKTLSGMTRLTVAEVLADTRRLWAVLVKACEEAGGTGHDPDCGECREIEASDWWLRCVPSADAPGAFPVVIWSP